MNGLSNQHRRGARAAWITREGLRLTGLSDNWLFGTWRATKRLNRVFADSAWRSAACIATQLVTQPGANYPARKATDWSRALIELLGVEIVRQGELPDSGVLLVANHRSYIDIAVILKDLPCTFLAKAEVKKWPVLGFAAQTGQTIFVKRSDKHSRKLARQALRERMASGISVVVFPEGTSYEGPGLLPYKRGVFDMAAEAGLPVVPVAIEYADPSDAWVGDDTFIGHFYRTFRRPACRVTIEYGPVFCSRDGAQLRHDCWKWTENALFNLRNGNRDITQDNISERRA